MDLFIVRPPVSIAPPPVAAEPPIYIAHAGNPTPTFASNNHNHPPYAKMITAAIMALKERNGSSHQAIAKYIDKNYSSLPSNHSALLTHHLKRLKNNGHLLMVKHSYKVPRSVLLSSTDSDAAADDGGGSGSSGPKRGRGRSPKPKVVVDVQQPPHNVVVGPESVLVSLGPTDGPVPLAKKRPGRPPKAKTGFVGSFVGSIKRGPGRPPRPKSLPVSIDGSGFVGSEFGWPLVVKRGRGRPPKMGQIGPKMRSVRLPRTGLIGPRPRKRLKRDVPVVKPLGRRTKNVVTGGGDGVALSGVGSGVLPAKRRGRPPRVVGIKKPRKLPGRPLGRPRKDYGAAIFLADSENMFAQILEYPEKFGFKNTTGPCCGEWKALENRFNCGKNSSYCGDRDEYVFFDRAHSTDAANKLFVDYCLSGRVCSPLGNV